PLALRRRGHTLLAEQHPVDRVVGKRADGLDECIGCSPGVDAPTLPGRPGAVAEGAWRCARLTVGARHRSLGASWQLLAVSSTQPADGALPRSSEIRTRSGPARPEASVRRCCAERLAGANALQVNQWTNPRRSVCGPFIVSCPARSASPSSARPR